MGENIGAAARAMANFGLTDLRIVAPRDGWPNPKASDTAGKAINLIDDAMVHETAEAAVADCQFVLATTSRARAVNMPVLEVRDAMREVRARIARGEKCALLFGAERTGLENEEVALADAVLTIPVAPEYPSLNLGQAVVVVGHEWFSAAGEGENPLFTRNALQVTPPPEPATREELHGFFGQLEEALDAVDFWRVPAKKEGMWRNIRAGLMRAGLSANEVATWRGIVRSLTSREGVK
jgi:tRNA/rRNA methyltransferase